MGQIRVNAQRPSCRTGISISPGNPHHLSLVLLRRSPSAKFSELLWLPSAFLGLVSICSFLYSCSRNRRTAINQALALAAAVPAVFLGIPFFNFVSSGRPWRGITAVVAVWLDYGRSTARPGSASFTALTSRHAGMPHRFCSGTIRGFVSGGSPSRRIRWLWPTRPTGLFPLRFLKGFVFWLLEVVG